MNSVVVGCSQFDLRIPDVLTQVSSDFRSWSISTWSFCFSLLRSSMLVFCREITRSRDSFWVCKWSLHKPFDASGLGVVVVRVSRSLLHFWYLSEIVCSCDWQSASSVGSAAASQNLHSLETVWGSSWILLRVSKFVLTQGLPDRVTFWRFLRFWKTCPFKIFSLLLSVTEGGMKTQSTPEFDTYLTQSQPTLYFRRKCRCRRYQSHCYSTRHA